MRSRLLSAALAWTVGMATFLATMAAAPVIFGPMRPATAEPQPNPVDRLYADHRCAPTQGPGRTMLLISTPAGGAELIEAAATADELAAQTNWLTDQRASFYGWCEQDP